MKTIVRNAKSLQELAKDVSEARAAYAKASQEALEQEMVFVREINVELMLTGVLGSLDWRVLVGDSSSTYDFAIVSDDKPGFEDALDEVFELATILPPHMNSTLPLRMPFKTPPSPEPRMLFINGGDGARQVAVHVDGPYRLILDLCDGLNILSLDVSALQVECRYHAKQLSDISCILAKYRAEVSGDESEGGKCAREYGLDE